MVTARCRSTRSAEEPLHPVTPAEWWHHVPSGEPVVKRKVHAADFPVVENADTQAARRKVAQISSFREYVRRRELGERSRAEPFVRDRPSRFLPDKPEPVKAPEKTGSFHDQAAAALRLMGVFK